MSKTADTIEKGSMVTFVGFVGDEIPDHGDSLVVGEQYEVSNILEGEEGEDDLVYELKVPNPKFDVKKKSSKTNQEFVYPTVYDSEFETAIEVDNKTAITPEDMAVGQILEVEDEEGPVEGKVVKITKSTVTIQDEEENEIEFKISTIQSILLIQEAPSTKTSTKTPVKKETKEAVKAKVEPEKTKTKTKDKKEVTTKPKKAEVKKSTKPSKAVTKIEEEEDPELKGMIILTEEEEDPEIVELLANTEDVCGLAAEIADQTSRDEYRLGGILYHIRVNKEYKEIDKRYSENKGFELYVQEQLRIGYRKAMYLIDIYAKFNKYGLESEKVAEIGWTKAQKIAQHMTEENAEELYALATEMTAADLGDEIKERYKRVGEDTRDRIKLVTFKFKLAEDQADSIKNYLEQAATQLGEKKLDGVFAHIINEWAMDHLNIDKPKRTAHKETETKQETTRKGRK